MSILCRLVHSSIGKKLLVAVAGLLLCGFLVTHLAGNLLLFVSEGAFNDYAKTLETNPFLVPAEIALAALFLLHIVVSLWLRVQNRRARPVGYEMSRSKGGRSLGSRSMAVSGVLVLVFLIVHIRTFKFGEKFDGLYRLVMDSFANPLYSAFYVVAMLGLMLHLSHGVQSAFQTFGLNHPKWTPLVRKAGFAFAGAIAGGFALIPIISYLKGAP